MNEAACRRADSLHRGLTSRRSGVSLLSVFCFSNLCLCHHSIKSGSSLGHLLGQRAGWGWGGGGGVGGVPLSPRSENVSRLCSLLPFALWWNLVFSACLAMWSSYKRRRGRGRLAARICTSMRACVRACVCVCLLVCGWGGLKDHTAHWKEGFIHRSHGGKSCT